jgi:DNA-3-methyladenine glycosylase II
MSAANGSKGKKKPGEAVSKKSLKRGEPAPLAHLRRADPILYAAALPHAQDVLNRKGHRRSYQQLFDSLAGAIVGQQLSTKAADTIWERLKTACKGSVTPESIMRLRVPTLRKAGLSAAKVKSLKELSKAILEGSLKLEMLKKVPEEEAIAQLSAIWGIGRWTAEMFLMFALEREDVFSPGDLGLRRSMETLYSLAKDVPIKQLEIISAKWSPHRTFASRILWRLRDAK